MTQKPTLTPETTIIRNQELLFESLDDELVLMSIENAKFYGMNETSKRIWEIIAEPQPIKEVCAFLLAEYEIDEETCQAKVLEVAQKLIDSNLAHIVEK